jgi:hypothetical protein
MQIGKVKVEMPAISVGIPFAYLHQAFGRALKCKHKGMFALFLCSINT